MEKIMHVRTKKGGAFFDKLKNALEKKSQQKFCFFVFLVCERGKETKVKRKGKGKREKEKKKERKMQVNLVPLEVSSGEIRALSRRREKKKRMTGKEKEKAEREGMMRARAGGVLAGSSVLDLLPDGDWGDLSFALESLSLPKPFSCLSSPLPSSSSSSPPSLPLHPQTAIVSGDSLSPFLKWFFSSPSISSLNSPLLLQLSPPNNTLSSSTLNASPTPSPTVLLKILPLRGEEKTISFFTNQNEENKEQQNTKPQPPSSITLHCTPTLLTHLSSLLSLPPPSSSLPLTAQIATKNNDFCEWERVVVVCGGGGGEGGERGGVSSSMGCFPEEGMVSFVLRKKGIVGQLETFCFKNSANRTQNFQCLCFSKENNPQNNEENLSENEKRTKQITQKGIITSETKIILSRIPLLLPLPLAPPPSPSSPLSQNDLTQEIITNIISHLPPSLLPPSLPPPPSSSPSPSLLLCGPHGSGKTHTIHSSLSLLLSLLPPGSLPIFRITQAMLEGGGWSPSPSLSSSSSSPLCLAIQYLFHFLSLCSPCILWIEEIDDIFWSGAGKGGGGGEDEEGEGEGGGEGGEDGPTDLKGLAAFLAGIVNNKGDSNNNNTIFLIATAKHTSSLHPSLRPHFPQTHHLKVPPPPLRSHLFTTLSPQYPFPSPTPTSLPDLFREISKGCHGFLPIDIASVLEKIAQNWAQFQQERHGVTPLVTDPDRYLCDKSDASFAEFVTIVKRVVKSHRPSVLGKWHVQLPRVGWGEIGGLEEVKRMVQESVVWPFQHAEDFERVGVGYPKGVLLYGPPGTGKTMLAQAIATESNSNFIYISITDVIKSEVGGSERALAGIFSLARSASPCVLFFDEMQAMIGSRGGGGRGEGEGKEEGEEEEGHEEDEEEEEEEEDWGGTDGSTEAVSQLILEIDGLHPSDHVIVIGATNLPWAIDPHLLHSSRLSRAIHVPLPGKEERERILKLCLAQVPIHPSLSILELSNKTEGFSGADIKNLVRKAGFECVKRSMLRNTKKGKGGGTGELSLSMIDFEEALNGCSPTVSDETLKKLGRWEEKSKKRGGCGK